MGKIQELVSEKSQDPQVVDKGNRETREALALEEGTILKTFSIFIKSKRNIRKAIFVLQDDLN